MFKGKLLLIAVLFLISFTYPVVAQDADGMSDNSSAQENKYSDFEDWYEPEDAYQQDDQNQPTENVVGPKGGEDEPRVAPDEDTRPKER